MAAGPAISVTADERAAAPRHLPSAAMPTLLMLPGTASPDTVRWSHFGDMAAAARAGGWAVRVAAGPDEEALVAGLAAPGEGVPTLGLGELAALVVAVVEAGGAVVGNDSGLSHLAAAALRGRGPRTRPGARGLRLHLAGAHGPPGTTAHHGTRPDCWPCYAKTCGVGRLCLDAAADAVFAAVSPQP